MIIAPANAPSWAQDFAKTIDSELNARLSAVPRLPVVELASLTGGQMDPAKFFSNKPGMRGTALLGVVATGGLTVCFSDGSDWIDVQTGAPVA